MLNYVFKRRQDGICIIDVKKTWEKLLLAARIIASIENPADVCVISSRNYGQVQPPLLPLHPFTSPPIAFSLVSRGIC